MNVVFKAETSTNFIVFEIIKVNSVEFAMGRLYSKKY